MNKILLIVGLVIAIGGVIFSVLPHDVHNVMLGTGKVVMDGHTDHTHSNHGVFVTAGLSSAVIGLGMVFAGWKLF